MNALMTMELEELYDRIDEMEADAETADEAAGDSKEKFRINDLGAANWAFRKIKAMQQKISENKALAEAEQIRISNWLNSQTKKDENTIAFFESLLIDYFHSEREKDRRFKLSTPYGKVSAAKKTNWLWNDDSKIIIKSLKDAGLDDYIRVKEEPKKQDIKGAENVLFIVTDIGTLVTTDGEVINGVMIEKGESISVKVV